MKLDSDADGAVGMARVAVLHNTLDFHGGADAVALTTCDALEDEHTVDLFTISTTDPGDLASQYGLDIDIRVREPRGAALIAHGFAAAAPHVGPQLDSRSALLAIFFRRHADAYDLAVSTTNELAIPCRSIQYVHYPQFHLNWLPDRAATAGPLNRLWSHVGGPARGRGPSDATLVANSTWTATAVQLLYGQRPEVVYPPVPPIEGREPWAEREQGVVVIGRIAPERRVTDAIDIVDGVRERGYDLHLHIVGSAPPAYRRYVEHVWGAVAEREHVSLETDVSRERLEALLCTHRYGVNTCRYEPFGIGLAEYLAAGMLAFAPANGGQVEVLDGRADRLFESVDDAVERLTCAIDTGARPDLPLNRFGRDRFRQSMRALVADALE